MAIKVADTLHIPLASWNFEKEYRERVFQAMIAEYRRGRTPNPDILCNREIKFDIFLDHALRQADNIATGHYARTDHGRLYKGIDSEKDQSYFLSAVSSAALEKTFFPIGEMRKSDVRLLAKEAGLPNWDRPDSVGICFVGEKKMTEFLRTYIPDQPGDIITDAGMIIGQHPGIHQFTIGQRHGLGAYCDPRKSIVAGLPSGEPLFVIAKDLEKKTITVAAQSQVSAHRQREIVADHTHWIRRPSVFPWTGTVKLRYRQVDVPCSVAGDGDVLRITLHNAQSAITPGQYAVLYQGDECLGCAVITDSAGEKNSPTRTRGR